MEKRVDQRRIPFRFPYLSQGFQAEKRRAIFRELEKLGSPHVPVTIETRDWLYAKAYLEALHAGRSVREDRLRRTWFWDIQEATIEAEFEACRLFGRLPPQVLLLHANRLNADHPDGALAWLVTRGYEFATLEEVLDDPAFHESDRSYGYTSPAPWERLRRNRSLSGKTRQ